MKDYQTKGCTQYGAYMGRTGKPLDATCPLTLRHVALTDGYDHGGAYWGDPSNLYMVTDTVGGVAYRRGTPESVRAEWPEASWAPVTEGPSDSDIDEMVDAYIEAALWSESDEDDNPLDSNYWAGDLGEGVREKMRADCAKFARENAAQIVACFGSGKCSWSQAGHDFWLTRNGHGCGFWDGDWPEAAGGALTRASKQFGECYLHVGDDGRVWL